MNKFDSALCLILISFFKLQYLYNISNRAASAILALISFVLGLVAHPLALIFPKTLSSAIKATKVDTCIEKVKYAVCPNENCNALYQACHHIDKCTEISFGKVCGTSLGYERHLSNGKKKWKSYKIFQFIRPSTWLKKMFASKEFTFLIEQCSDKRDPGILEDVYDGRVWKDVAAQGYFNCKYDIALMMNVDWFKPFKRSEYKVAAFMMTVLNLPREERFKKKWTMITGIYKGMHSSCYMIGCYLDCTQLYTIFNL